MCISEKKSSNMGKGGLILKNSFEHEMMHFILSLEVVHSRLRLAKLWSGKGLGFIRKGWNGDTGRDEGTRDQGTHHKEERRRRRR